MAEIAIAADSELYRSSSDAWTIGLMTRYATQEAPRLIAKNVKYWLDHIKQGQDNEATLYWWNYKENLCDGECDPENLGHGHFTLLSLVSFWENRGALDGLLARYGYSERAGLNWSTFTGIANTFLRRIWTYDYTPDSTLRNVLRDRVDGGVPVSLQSNANENCAGYAALAQFDPWVWVRCRDSVFNPYVSPPPLREDNHAALLRYRSYWANR
jgi:hypothetical protein